MFRHISAFLSKLWHSMTGRQQPTPAVFRDNRASPVTPPIYVDHAPAQPARRTEPSTLQRKRHEMASALVGVGFTDPIFDAPEGFFWKQDEGAADTPLDHVRRWRLYRERP